MSEALQYHVLDVFTEQRLAGNPLAVVMDADGLDGEHMQAIAREFNLSETVFMLTPTLAGAAARVRIFTTGRELPFAGHPTVGTACLLAELGLIATGEDVDIVLQEAVGPVPVRVRREPGRACHAQLTTAVLPSFDKRSIDVAGLAPLLGLRAEDIETMADAPRGASCGVPFNLVPLRSREALSRAQLLPGAVNLAGGWSDAFYLYVLDGERISARMFASGMGMTEDPATGSAAAALCGHLADGSSMSSGTLSWNILQGVEMLRPSHIGIEADKVDGRIAAIRVGGHSVRIASGNLSL